jgi:NTP pyrophosphatase (non-canonical NTP hydrolase)
MPTTGERFERAVQIMARLRAPGGCPWDREQTFDTIKPYTLEETYEVIEAIDNRDWPELTGELGDLLLQVLFYSQMASEEGHFSVDDVLDRQTLKIAAPVPGAVPSAFHLSGNRLAISFWDEESQSQTVIIADAQTGRKIASYSDATGVGASFACYSANEGVFTFLKLGEGTALEVIRAEAQ